MSSSSTPPPPKFPRSGLNPGPETPNDWDQFIRWLLKLYRATQPTSPDLSALILSRVPYPVPVTVTLSIPRAQVQMLTNTVELLATGATVALPFDTLLINSTGNIWTKSQPTRLTAPAAGDYFVYYTCPAMASNFTNSGSQIITVSSADSLTLSFYPAFFQIRKNGVAAQVYGGTAGGGYFWDKTGPGGFSYVDGQPHAAGNFILTLNAGDYLELIAWQNYTPHPDQNLSYPGSGGLSGLTSTIPTFGMFSLTPSLRVP